MWQHPWTQPGNTSRRVFDQLGRRQSFQWLEIPRAEGRKFAPTIVHLQNIRMGGQENDKTSRTYARWHVPPTKISV
ncbi:hypothetical protein EI94DRAFT_1713425, partial [Lactarius quietus]